MPVENILYLAFVMAALTQFAAVLAYAEWTTRHANEHVHNHGQFERVATPHHEQPDLIRKAA